VFQIAGVRIFGISKGGEEELGELVSLIKSPVMKAMIPNILTLLEAADTKNRLDVESYGDFLFVSVDRNFRGQGLATEMYQRAIDVLKAERCPAAQSIFTSPHSQRIARNLGFKELSRMKLKDYKTPEGDSLFPNATDDEVAIVMALKF
jgi:ribosomal protein S18 acetylase RimI-like enzyme